MYDIAQLNEKLVGELKEIARQLNIPNYESLKKQELVYKILDVQAANPEMAAKATEPKKAEAPTPPPVEQSGDDRPKRKRIIPVKSPVEEVIAPAPVAEEELIVETRNES